MAVDVAVPRTRSRTGLGLAGRIVAAPAHLVLAALVVASTGLRSLLAFAHAVPVYFPDEYIYSALARGIAEHGRPVIRGHAAHFPALLEPLLAAPLWLGHDPSLAYRLTQLENGLLMSLGAIPVYLIARRLGCEKWVALGLGGLALATPDFFFSSFVLAGPAAYPLVLAAVYSGICALERPTRRAQLAFVAFSGLAAFARIQYVVLPVALIAAALVLERGNALTVLRRLRLALGILVALAAVFVATGPAHALGYYSGVAHEHVRPLGLLHWAGVDAMLLGYSTGVVLVPGALIGLALGLCRPRSRVEQAFATLTVALAAAVFAEAALYASNGSGRYQERYLMALLPLIAIAFVLYVRRGLPARKAVAAFAAGFVGLSASVPLSGYTLGDGKQDSPLLFGVFWLEKHFGGAGSGSLLVALAAAALCALAIALTYLGRRALPTAFVATAAVFGVISVGAYAVDWSNASDIRHEFLPTDRQWIDHARLGHVTLLETPGAPFGQALEQLLWNRSVDSVLLLGDTPPIDKFDAHVTRIARDGRLMTKSGIVRGPLVIEDYAAHVVLRNAHSVAAGGSFELWRPDGTPRVDLIAFGRYQDGWLAGEGRVFVWPGPGGVVAGSLKMTLISPPTAAPLVIRFTGRGVNRSVRLQPGEQKQVVIPVRARGLWQLGFRSSMHGVLWDGRAVSVRVGGPVFVRS